MPVSEWHSLQQIYRAARSRMEAGHWAFTNGGAESETTLKRNRLALDSLAFRPRVLRDVSRVDPSTALLGRRLRLPVLLAPIGGMAAMIPGGALDAARAAAAFGSLSFKSSVSEPALAEVVAAAPAAVISQVYVRGDEAWLHGHIREAQDLGCRAFCFTVDIAYFGRRERDIIGGASPRIPPPPEQLVHQAALNWDVISRARDAFDLPLIVKGIATPEDAGEAVARGIDIIHVSNHGGRQLDFGLGTMDILPEVVAAVRGRAAVIVDGGFMRGTDVLKAVALGADAVALGKLQVWALAAGGEAGLMRALEILEDEITNAMGLLGVAELAALGPQYLCKAPPVAEPGITSAYPFIDGL